MSLFIRKTTNFFIISKTCVVKRNIFSVFPLIRIFFHSYSYLCSILVHSVGILAYPEKRSPPLKITENIRYQFQKKICLFKMNNRFLIQFSSPLTHYFVKLLLKFSFSSTKTIAFTDFGNLNFIKLQIFNIFFFQKMYGGLILSSNIRTAYYVVPIIISF